FNLDGRSITEGTKFNVEYYAKPGPEQFVQIVERVSQNGKYYIDHAGLDNNPGAQVRVFPTSSPTNGALYNRSAVKIEYDAAVSRWFIANINNEPLAGAGTAFNIAYSGGTNTTGANTIKNATTETKSSAITSVTSINSATSASGSLGANAIWPKVDHSKQSVFVSVVGNTQGLFLGDNSTHWMEVSGFEMEGNVPRDMQSGLATGRRQLLPVSFQSAIGTSSMQFFKAYKSNEGFSKVSFEMYEPNPNGSGTIRLAYRIVLTNASINNFKQIFNEGQKGFFNSIKLTFQSIEINLIDGGWVESDTWIQANQ
ncbi:MAG: type VI secretion system tube protein Hcp, partial [Chitinophagales bacterium]